MSPSNSLTEISAAIDALATNYPRSQQSPESHAVWLANFARDLGQFPADRVRLACDNWRRGEATRMPAPGQLIKLCDALAPKPAAARMDSRPWSWGVILDAEYEGMTLREKHREIMLRAIYCGKKKGPMMINGRPALAEEMGDVWHEWRRREADYVAEAGTLQRLINERYYVADGTKG